jgi:hypothetical protein
MCLKMNAHNVVAREKSTAPAHLLIEIPGVQFFESSARRGDISLSF